MSKSKPRGKDKKKSSQLVLRIEKSERDAFVALCEKQDTTAAREIRRFMRERVAACTVPADVVDAHVEIGTPLEPITEVASEELQEATPQVLHEPKKRKSQSAA